MQKLPLPRFYEMFAPEKHVSWDSFGRNNVIVALEHVLLAPNRAEDLAPEENIFGTGT